MNGTLHIDEVRSSAADGRTDPTAVAPGAAAPKSRPTFAWRMVVRRPNWPFWRIGAVRPTERHGTSTR